MIIKTRKHKRSDGKIFFQPVLEMKKVQPIIPIQEELEKIYKIWEKNKSELGYISYFHFKREIGLEKLFGILKYIYIKNPYSLRFQVNRMGENVYFKIMVNKEDFLNII